MEDNIVTNNLDGFKHDSDVHKIIDDVPTKYDQQILLETDIEKLTGNRVFFSENINPL